MKRGRVKTTACVLLATAGLALACDREARDAKLDQAVLVALKKEPALAATDLHVRNEGSHVFLSGRVQVPAQRTLAGEIADDVYGVDRVTNDIQVDVAAPPPSKPLPEEPR